MVKVVNGIITQQFIKGWWGGNDEGETLLSALGLPTDKVPFDVEEYLNKGKTQISLDNGATAEVTVNKQDAYFEFMCEWPGKRYHFKLFREWDGMELDTILKMESYSIGECTRKVMTSKSIL